MTTYRCFACGQDLEVEKTKEFDLVEVKPCESCLTAAEESAAEAAEEAHWQGHDAAINEIEEEKNYERH